MKKSTKENTTTITNGTALLNEPSYDARDLLNDPEQLRAIVKALTIQIEALIGVPHMLQSKNVQQALEMEALALHVVTCEDCGDVRGDSGEHLPADKLGIVQELFTALDEIIQKDQAYSSDVQGLSDGLRSTLVHRVSEINHTVVRPLND